MAIIMVMQCGCVAVPVTTQDNHGTCDRRSLTARSGAASVSQTGPRPIRGTRCLCARTSIRRGQRVSAIACRLGAGGIESHSCRRGARAAEWTGLENRCTACRTEGSNPSLSVGSSGPAEPAPAKYESSKLHATDVCLTTGEEAQSNSDIRKGQGR